MGRIVAMFGVSLAALLRLNVRLALLSGAVVPLFREQIKRGGPVTVTHPDVIRYFMTIPEASQLVLQAGSMGKGGEIMLLDMGEPVKIVNLAEELIRLSGLKPYEDIDITFTGLRPGEKLYEEMGDKIEIAKADGVQVPNEMGKMSMPELHKLAGSLGIKSYGMKKYDIIVEIEKKKELV